MAPISWVGYPVNRITQLLVLGRPPSHNRIRRLSELLDFEECIRAFQDFPTGRPSFSEERSNRFRSPSTSLNHSGQ